MAKVIVFECESFLKTKIEKPTTAELAIGELCWMEATRRMQEPMACPICRRYHESGHKEGNPRVPELSGR
jgi:hypothetical protein